MSGTLHEAAGEVAETEAAAASAAVDAGHAAAEAEIAASAAAAAVAVANSTAALAETEAARIVAETHARIAALETELAECREALAEMMTHHQSMMARMVEAEARLPPIPSLIPEAGSSTLTPVEPEGETLVIVAPETIEAQTPEESAADRPARGKRGRLL